MTTYDWDVIQYGVVVGTADIDMDLVRARLITGKAVWRAGKSNSQGITTYHDHLLRKMVVGQIIVDHTDPDAPMQARKLGPGKMPTIRVLDENAVPDDFIRVSKPSVRYDSGGMSTSGQAWVKERVSEMCPIPSAPHVSVSPEAAFKRIVVFNTTRSAPLTAEQKRLTAELTPEYGAIITALSINSTEPWVMKHRETGLVIRHRGPSRSPALSAYRKHLVDTGQNALLVREEESVPSRLDIRRYIPDENAEAERAGLAAYGD